MWLKWFSTTSEATHFSPYALTQASDPTAPATPSGLAVSTPSSATQLTFTWSANSESDLSGYYVYRDTSSGGSFALLATLGAVTTYTNTGLSGPRLTTTKLELTTPILLNQHPLKRFPPKHCADSGGIMSSGGGGGGAPLPSIRSSRAQAPAPHQQLLVKERQSPRRQQGKQQPKQSPLPPEQQSPSPKL